MNRHCPRPPDAPEKFSPAALLPRACRVLGICLASTLLAVSHACGGVMVLGPNYDGEANVPPGSSNFVALTMGLWHVVTLTRGGEVKAWGYNLYGQANVPAG